MQYAALCARRAPRLHLYPDASADELGYMLEDSGAALLFAEDQEQVDKVAAGRRCGVPACCGIVYLDGRGLWNYDDPLLLDFARFLAEAPDDAAARAALDAGIDAGSDDDLAVDLLHLGHHRAARRACVLSHGYLLDNAYRLMASFGIAPHVDYFSYISPAWAAEQFSGVGLGLLAPAVVHFAEKPETVPTDMREIGPEFLMFTPRQWEMLAAADRGQRCWSRPLAAALYRWAIARAGAHALARRLRWCSRAHPRQARALARQRVSRSAAAPGMSAEMFRRFHALRHPARAISTARPNSVSSPRTGAPRPSPRRSATIDGSRRCDRRPARTLRIADRTASCCVARRRRLLRLLRTTPRRPNRSRRRRLFHTGDAVHVNERGELIFLDRVKDMRRLVDGAARSRRSSSRTTCARRRSCATPS